jgi:hypothetical protein
LRADTFCMRRPTLRKFTPSHGSPMSRAEAEPAGMQPSLNATGFYFTNAFAGFPSKRNARLQVEGALR